MSTPVISDTLHDALEYVLSLVQGETDKSIAVVNKYDDDTIRDLMGCSAGVIAGIFSHCTTGFKERIAAGLQYGLTNDDKWLAIARQDETVVGGYL